MQTISTDKPYEDSVTVPMEQKTVVAHLGGIDPEKFTLDYGSALKWLKAGEKVARKGWNGKNMFVYLEKGYQDGNDEGNAINIDGVDSDLFIVSSKLGKTTTVMPCFCMFSATGTIVKGWLASPTDMLAEDWAVLIC